MTDEITVQNRVVLTGCRRLAALIPLVLLTGTACVVSRDVSDQDLVLPGLEAPETTTGTATETAIAPQIAGQNLTLDVAPEIVVAVPTEPEQVPDQPNNNYPEPIRSSGNTAFNIADRITELPPAQTGAPFAAPEGPRPVGLTIDALGVRAAEVLGVGVEDNGDMEIPPADQVGWYQFGAKPGDEAGSAVLAAHIAYNGRDGVFVDLDELSVGARIEVVYDDGTVVAYIATELRQYDKSELPDDKIFNRDGDHQLVLITCGGDFNREISSYEDNVVVFAQPVDLA